MDTVVLNQYQKFSEWSQVRFDKNCYWWEYICTHASGIVCIVAVIAKLYSAETLTFTSIIKQFDWHDGILLLIAAVDFSNLNRRKKKSQSDKPQLSFVVSPVTRIMRIIFLIYMIVFIPITDEISDILPFIWASIYYFADCRPLPPSEADRRRSASFKPQTA